MHRLMQAAVAGELGHLERVERVRELGGRCKPEPGGFDQPLCVLVDPRPVAPLQVGAG